MFYYLDSFQIQEYGKGEFIIPNDFLRIFQDVIEKKGLKTKNNYDMERITKSLFIDKLKKSDVNFTNFIFDALCVKMVGADNVIYSLIKKSLDSSIVKVCPRDLDWTFGCFRSAKDNYMVHVNENAYIDSLLDSFASYKPFINSDITMVDLFDEFCDLLHEIYLENIEIYNTHYGTTLSESDNCWFMNERNVESFKKTFKSYLIRIVVKQFEYSDNKDLFVRLYDKKIDLLLKELNLSLDDAFEYLKKFINPLVDIYHPSFELDAQYSVNSIDDITKLLSKMAFKDNGKKYSVDEIIEFLMLQDPVIWQQDKLLYSDMEELDSVIDEDYDSIYADTYYQTCAGASVRKGY